MEEHFRQLLILSSHVAPDAQEMYSAALQSLRNGQKHTAQEQLCSLLLKSPGFSYARSDLGALLMGQGRAELAELFFESAYRQQPAFAPFALNLAKIYLHNGKHHLATPILLKLQIEQPGNGEIQSLCLSCGIKPSSQLQPDHLPDLSSSVEAGLCRVALFYDEPGWAWWHRSHNIKRALAGQFQIDILQLGRHFDQQMYDLCLVYDHCVLHLLPPIPPKKLIVGNSCPKMLPGFIQLMKDTGCLAGVVNNKFAYETALKEVGPIFLCQNGVDSSFFYPSPIIPQTFAACWVGNSGSMGNKGLDLIQEACRQTGIELVYIDAKEALAGGGTVATQQQIRDNIYHRASVYVCASEYEGTPNPALEALACGLGVISTRVGNMPEILVEGWNGCIIERSVSGIALGLQTMREIDRTQLRIRSRVSIALGWDWQTQVLKYGAMFRTLQQTAVSESAASELRDPASRQDLVAAHTPFLASR